MSFTGEPVRHAIDTVVPARLDPPWWRRHCPIVIGPGAGRILDGPEATVAGNIAGRPSGHGSGLPVTDGRVTGPGPVGACAGASFLGRLTDRFGRKKLGRGRSGRPAVRRRCRGQAAGGHRHAVLGPCAGRRRNGRSFERSGRMTGRRAT